MDTFSPEERSKIMAKVKSKDTRPEMIVRKIVWRMGYRYRLHCENLPGKPDLAFKGRKKAIFVNGCFWHGHQGCPAAKLPESNFGYWQEKISGNQKRDAKNRAKLEALGWKSLVLWECELRNIDVLAKRLKIFLG